MGGWSWHALGPHARQHMGDGRFRRQSCLDQPCWSWRLNDASVKARHAYLGRRVPGQAKVCSSGLLYASTIPPSIQVDQLQADRISWPVPKRINSQFDSA